MNVTLYIGWKVEVAYTISIHFFWEVAGEAANKSEARATKERGDSLEQLPRAGEGVDQ